MADWISDFLQAQKQTLNLSSYLGFFFFFFLGGWVGWGDIVNSSQIKSDLQL